MLLINMHQITFNLEVRFYQEIRLFVVTGEAMAAKLFTGVVRLITDRAIYSHCGDSLQVKISQAPVTHRRWTQRLIARRRRRRRYKFVL